MRPHWGVPMVRPWRVLVRVWGAVAGLVAEAVAHMRFVRNYLDYTALTLEITVGPLLYLWPWVLGAAVFFAFLGSDQGTSIARSFDAREHAAGITAASLILTWALVAMGCLLALVASRRGNPPTRVPTTSRPWRRIARHSSNGIWLGAVSASPLIMFAHAASYNAAWVVTSVLVLISVVGTGWAAFHATDAQSAASRCLSLVSRHSFWFAGIAILMALIPLAAGAWVAAHGPSRLADAGSLLVGMVGIAANSTLFGVALVVVPLSLQRWWIGAAVAGFMILWNALQPAQIDFANPLLEDNAVEADIAGVERKCEETPRDLFGALDRQIERSEWFADKNGNDERFFLVSAEGGGIRAAYWTALYLQKLEIASGGHFAERVVLLSGVSGGSLGIATWLAAHERQDLNAERRFELISDFLTSDFLSPLVGGLLFLDVPRFILGPLWPSVRRDHVFEKAFAELWRDKGRTDFFSRPFMDLCLSGFKKAPAVFFNATDALTGTTVSLSPTSIRAVGKHAMSLQLGATGISGSFNNTSLAEATVAQAVHISARFPYLSPPANVGIDPEWLAELNEWGRVKEGLAPGDYKRALKEIHARIQDKGLSRTERWPLAWALVDGGYVDNTGLLVTEAAMSILKSELESAKEKGGGTAPKALQIIHLANDPEGACVPEARRDRASATVLHHLDVIGGKLPRCVNEIKRLEASLAPPRWQWLFAPLESLVSVRRTHSDRLIKQLSSNPVEISNHKLSASLTQDTTQPFGNAALSSCVREETKSSPVGLRSCRRW